ncbi:MAG: hypothetical protein LBR08_10390 [Bacteroidales bacterium]|jgi:hypothetical protein|nr:hypothetical protein [Bacteroidales bacterium]
MKAIERLHEYLNYKGLKPTRFEKQIGLSNGYLGTQLKRCADLGESIMGKIIDNCLDISPEWLLTGRGEMLKKQEENAIIQSITGNDNVQAAGNSNVDNRHYYSDSPDVLRAQVEEKDILLREKDERIKEKDAQIKEKDAQINKLLSILSNN